MENLSNHSSIHAECANSVSWGAILAGVVVAMTVGLLLNFLGAGLGFSAFTPSIERMEKLSDGIIVWMFLDAIVAMFLGGWVAAKLSSATTLRKSFWQGIVVSGLCISLMIMMAFTSLGMVFAGGLGLMNNADNSNVIKQSISLSNDNKNNDKSFMENLKSNLPKSLAGRVDQINDELNTFIESLDENVSDQMPSSEEIKNKVESHKERLKLYKQQITPAFERFIESIRTENYDAAKKHLVDLIAKSTNQKPALIEEKVNSWEKAYEDLKNQAIEYSKNAAQKSADFFKYISFLNFFIILVGLISAGVGGMLAHRCRCQS